MSAHSTAGWNIAIELSLIYREGHRSCVFLYLRSIILTETIRNVLLLFLEGQFIEFFPQGKLSIHPLLWYTKVLHIEEALFTNGVDKGPCQLLLAFRSMVETEINGDQIRPVKVFLRG